MMKKTATIFLIAFFALPVFAQRFRPYHAFGVQANANINGLTTRYDGSLQYLPSGQMNATSLRFDLLASYDYGLLKWLGIGSGIGFSIRGGASESYKTGSKKRRDIYYLNVPVTLQLKPWKFLWLEPGIETKYFIGYKDVNYSNEPFPSEDINSFDLTATAGLRFNLFTGLSLSAGYHFGLLPVAEVQLDDPFIYSQTTYKDFGAHVGVRYMFNQP